MIATQDDVQQDLMQRTQRWLDILEARTLALLATTNSEDLKPAERETSIHRSLQLTARFLQLRQKTSKASNPKPNYDAWLDQILSDPQPADSPPFDHDNQAPLKEENSDNEEVNDSPPETLEPQPKINDQPYTDSPPLNLNNQPTSLPGEPASQINQEVDRWPFAIIRPRPEGPPWLPECLI